MTKTIVQLAVFEVPLRRVYDTLMNSGSHSDFTGEKASIDVSVGGHFTAYDGYITGSFLKIAPYKSIVELWRASDWPKDVYSEVSIEFQEKRGVTTLHFTQENVPDEFAESIANGWHEYYWDKLRVYLEK